MATVTTLMQGSLFINGGTKGFSEKYYLPDNNYNNALVNFGRLCALRAAIMPSGFELAWARVSFVGAPRESKAAITAPLPALADEEDINVAGGFGVTGKTEKCLVYRFETADGKFAVRSFRAVPDVLITDDELATPITIDEDPEFAIPAAAAAVYVDIVGDFVGYVLKNTVHVKKLPGPTLLWEVTAFDRALFRRTGIRRTGHPFDTSVGRRSAA